MSQNCIRFKSLWGTRRNMVSRQFIYILLLDRGIIWPDKKNGLSWEWLIRGGLM